MSRALAWWRALPPGVRWGIAVGVVLLALALAAQLWGALVVAIGAFVGALTGRTPAHPGAAEAAGRARTAAELQAESARLLSREHRAEVAAAPARDMEADRAIAAAAQAAEVPPLTGEPAEAPPAFLVEIERRRGAP